MWWLLACAQPEDSGTAPPSESRSLVMSTLTFARRNEDGTTWGFDLDHRVSDAGDSEGCNKPDLVDPDGTPGIDSAFSALVPALEATEAKAVEGLIQDSINNGNLLLLVEVTGIDSYENDDCVNLRVLRAQGSPLLGTDGSLLDGQTFELNPEVAPAEVECAALKNGSVVAGPFSFHLPIQVLDVAVDFAVQDAYIRVDFAEDGTAWGFFDGAVPTGDILRIVEEGDLASIRDLVTNLVNSAADLHVSGPDTCDGLSISFEYNGKRSFVLE